MITWAATKFYGTRDNLDGLSGPRMLNRTRRLRV